MARNKIMLDDLKGWARKQVEGKLALRCARGVPGIGDAASHVPTPAEGKDTVLRTARREPNKTEAEYNRRYLGGLGKYESVSLRLPGGSRYTPDWQSAETTFILTLLKFVYFLFICYSFHGGFVLQYNLN